MQVARTRETRIVYIQFRSENFKEETDRLEDLIEIGRISGSCPIRVDLSLCTQWGRMVKWIYDFIPAFGGDNG